MPSVIVNQTYARIAATIEQMTPQDTAALAGRILEQIDMSSEETLEGLREGMGDDAPLRALRDNLDSLSDESEES